MDIKKIVLNIILLFMIVSVICAAIYLGETIKEAIQKKEQMDSLRKEDLNLEIKLLKIQLGKDTIK